MSGAGDWTPPPLVVGSDCPPDPDDAYEQDLTREQDFEREVLKEAWRLRIREVARARVAAAKAAGDPAAPFDAGTLAEHLARPPGPPHRAQDLIPADAGTLIVAQRKTGKTTLELNLARALVTGEDFLGRFATRPVTGRVAVLNFEVSGHTLATWARDVSVPADRLVLVNLRGRRNPLAHPQDRAALAELLRGHEVEALVVDPFGRAYTGTNQNDSGEVGAWLTDLDLFARAEVGARDVVLTTHAGWNGERSRGSSALEDWADSIVTLTRSPDDETVRFLKATGRDVEVEEDQLHFDPDTRLLSLTGLGSRRAAAAGQRLAGLAEAVVVAATTSPGMSGTELGVYLRNQGHSFQKGDELKAAKAAVEDGRLRIEAGTRGAKRYFLTDLPRPTPTSPGGVGATSPDPPYRRGGTSRGTSTPHIPRIVDPEREAHEAIGAALFAEHGASAS